jgi:flagellar biosynthesis regulator FlaF
MPTPYWFQILTAHVDWNGLAIFLTALGAFIISIGTFILQAIQLIKSKERSDRHEAKVDTLTKAVDGQANALNNAIAGQNFAEGKAEGVKEERTLAPGALVP